MKNKNGYIIAAGLINLFTSVLHLVGGQLTLVNPLMDGGLDTQVKAEWLGAWHMVTVFLFLSSFYLLRNGFGYKEASRDLLMFIGGTYVLFGLPSIYASMSLGVFAPQFILLMPIGLLVILGVKNGIYK